MPKINIKFKEISCEFEDIEVNSYFIDDKKELYIKIPNVSVGPEEELYNCFSISNNRLNWFEAYETVEEVEVEITVTRT